MSHHPFPLSRSVANMWKMAFHRNLNYSFNSSHAIDGEAITDEKRQTNPQRTDTRFSPRPALDGLNAGVKGRKTYGYQTAEQQVTLPSNRTICRKRGRGKGVCAGTEARHFDFQSQ